MEIENKKRTWTKDELLERVTRAYDITDNGIYNFAQAYHMDYKAWVSDLYIYIADYLSGNKADYSFTVTQKNAYNTMVYRPAHHQYKKEWVADFITETALQTMHEDDGTQTLDKYNAAVEAMQADGPEAAYIEKEAYAGRIDEIREILATHAGRKAAQNIEKYITYITAIADGYSKKEAAALAGSTETTMRKYNEIVATHLSL